MIVREADIALLEKGCAYLVVSAGLGEQGELQPCKLEVGQCVPLQVKHGAKGRKVTVNKVDPITGDSIVPEPFLGIRHAYGRYYLIRFDEGDTSQVYAENAERFLSKNGITTDPLKAIKGEPAVTTFSDLSHARGVKIERQLEEREALRAEKAEAEKAIDRLRSQGFSKDVQRALRDAQRSLERAERILAQEQQAA